MFTAIIEAIAKGVPVVITSRVPNGRVLPNYGTEGGGKTLVEAGVVMGDDLSAHKARILLMLLPRWHHGPEAPASRIRPLEIQTNRAAAGSGRVVG